MINEASALLSGKAWFTHCSFLAPELSQGWQC